MRVPGLGWLINPREPGAAERFNEVAAKQAENPAQEAKIAQDAAIEAQRPPTWSGDLNATQARKDFENARDQGIGLEADGRTPVGEPKSVGHDPAAENAVHNVESEPSAPATPENNPEKPAA